MNENTTGPTKNLMMVDGNEDRGDSEPDDMIINESDGLPGLHETTYSSDLESILENINSATYEQLINDEDLPTSLIVTNLNIEVFLKDHLKVSICDRFYVPSIADAYCSNRFTR